MMAGGDEQDKLDHRQTEPGCDHGEKWPEGLQLDDVVNLQNRNGDPQEPA